jgi:branched-subunit amino acid aminotransferase/4-amino-4-deoxychorismate lyase
MHKAHKYLVDGIVTDGNSITNGYNSRGFLYADGFFETLRIIESKIPLLGLHFGRITDSLDAYNLIAPDSLQLPELESSILKLASSVGLENHGRVRITIYRSGNGTYLPTTNMASWIATIERPSKDKFQLNEKGVSIGIFEEFYKTPDKFSNFKNLNCQISIQASIFAQEKRFNDVLILNSSREIIEATSSNIFLVKDGALYTPKLSAGPVGGVMRAAVINLSIELGIKVYECNIHAQELLKADEIFLTNAISGITWVASYRTKRYFNNTAKTLLKAFNSRI